MIAPLSLALCFFNPSVQIDNPPTSIKACFDRMRKLCAKHSVDWNSVFEGGGDRIDTHYTEKFVSLDLVGTEGLRYKLRTVRDAHSTSSGKEYNWLDRGITVYDVSLKELDENKITPSKKVSFRSTSTEPSSRYAYVFVLALETKNKVKVSYEDAHDSYSINGVAQTGEDAGTYSRPPRDRPSLVLNVSSVEDAQEVASLIKTAITIAKAQPNGLFCCSSKGEQHPDHGVVK